MDPELHREANDRYFGSEPPVNYGDEGAGVDAAPPEPEEEDKPGRFAVLIVYRDRDDRHAGIEREDSVWTTERRAKQVAGRVRENLEAAGYDNTSIRVDVLNLDDPLHRIVG